MFKQVKSAIFWYYLYKFRKRFVLITILLCIALFSNFIYNDVVEFLKLKNLLEYLGFALFFKWFIIIFNLSLCVYLLLTLFKSENKEDEKQKEKDEELKKEKDEEKFTQREKDILYKKKLNSKADILLKR